MCISKMTSKENMDSIEGVKVSDVFDLNSIEFPAYWSDQQVRVCGRAIASYDSHVELISNLKRMQEMLLCVVEGSCVSYSNEELAHHYGIDIESAAEINKLLED